MDYIEEIAEMLNAEEFNSASNDTSNNVTITESRTDPDIMAKIMEMGYLPTCVRHTEEGAKIWFTPYDADYTFVPDHIGEEESLEEEIEREAEEIVEEMHDYYCNNCGTAFDISPVEYNGCPDCGSYEVVRP